MWFPKGSEGEPGSGQGWTRSTEVRDQRGARLGVGRTQEEGARREGRCRAAIVAVGRDHRNLRARAPRGAQIHVSAVPVSLPGSAMQRDTANAG